MKLLKHLALAGLLASSMAHAATIQLGTLTIPPGATISTGGSCPIPANISAMTTVPAGTVLCTFVITPTGWQGVISGPTNGADSALFTIITAQGGIGSALAVGSTPLTATGSAAGNNVYQIGMATTTP